MTDELKECREAFHKWARENDYPLVIVNAEPPKYHESETQIAWAAWQAAWQQPRTKPEGVDIAGFLKWLDSELVYIGIIKSQTKHGNDDFVKGFGEACADATNNVEKLRRAIKQYASAWHLTAKE